jgi:hypothetical protein
MRDGHGGVPLRSFPQEEQGEGEAHRLGSSDHRDPPARDGDPVVLHDSERGERDGGYLHRLAGKQPTEILRSDPVNVFLDGKSRQRAEKVEGGGQRVLDQHPVDRRVRAQTFRDRCELGPARLRRERNRSESDPGRVGNLGLMLQVDREGGLRGAVDTGQPGSISTASEASIDGGPGLRENPLGHRGTEK